MHWNIIEKLHLIKPKLASRVFMIVSKNIFDDLMNKLMLIYVEITFKEQKGQDAKNIERRLLHNQNSA